jgi:predicted ATPase
MEEIVQELREQGMLSSDVGARRAVPLPSNLHIPTTVQGVLSARMDRLAPEEKALLQTLAVIGREFSSSLLQKVVTQPEDELHRLLARLQAGEFVYEQPAFPEVEYIFKHALTQEVAYNSLLIERRKTLHERTAQAIEDVYRRRLEDHYSELAYHYGRSGNTQKAVEYLHLAGQQAVQRSANTEAVTHLTAAIELLKTLLETPERDQQELTLQIALGAPLMATKGYAAPEVEPVLMRAHELGQQLGQTPQLAAVLRGLWLFSMVRAEFKTAREMAEQFLSLAQHVQDPILLLGAHEQMGFLLTLFPELISAHEHCEHAITHYDSQKHRTYVSIYEADLGMWAHAQVALVLWCLGSSNQALQRCCEALTLAQELVHPFSRAWVFVCAAWLHQYRREWQETQKWAESAMALSREQGFPLWEAWGTILHGGALAESGRGEEGGAQIRQGLETYRATGAVQAQPYFLALLAEAYGKVGQAEEGLSVVAEALAVVEKTEERFYEAELHRLKGELTLQQGKVESQKSKVLSPQPPTPSTQAEAEAEACFLKAIEISRKQQAKSLELRAVMSLVRLRQQQASKHGTGSAEQGARNTQHVTRTALDEARQMLSEVYNWFTEGFDTKDLQEAKALIEALRH